MGGETAQGDAISLRLPAQFGMSCSDPLVEQLSSPLGQYLTCPGWQRRVTCSLRIRILDLRAQPFSAHDHSKAIFLDIPQIDFYPRQDDLLQAFQYRHCLRSGNSSSPAVDDDALSV